MKNKVILSLLAGTAVTGCAAQQEAQNLISRNAYDASMGAEQAKTPMKPKDISPIKVKDSVFVGGKPVRNENGSPLPAKFERKNGITIVKTQPMDLREIAATLTEVTKIPVVVAAETSGGGLGGGGGSPAPSTGGDLGSAMSAITGNMPSAPPGFPVATPAIGGGSPMGGGIISAPARTPAGLMKLDYSGKLSSLLNVISAHFNVAWHYNGDRIIFDYVVTRSFDVPVLPIISNLEFELTSQSSTGGDNTAEAGQTAKTTSSSDTFKDIKATIDSMAGAGASTINTTTGVVSVTGDPATVARVGEYLRGLNERLSQQIVISVKVYSVVLSNRDDFELNVGAIFNNGKNGLNLGNAISASGVVPPVGGLGAGLGWALLDESSKWYGSNALFEALSEAGNVSVVTTASVTTANGIPVPLQVGELRDYVSKVETTMGSGDNSNTQTSIDTSSVTTGFNLHIVPRVERGGNLLLQYGINISELTGKDDGFDTFTTGGQTVQLRRINQRNFIQQANIPNGQTLVLAGFEQVRAAETMKGMGDPGFFLLGGSQGGETERQIIVIAITPTILDVNAKTK